MGELGAIRGAEWARGWLATVLLAVFAVLLTGCSAGFAMTTWMSYDWPLLVGGKPIASLPPYVVIMFELTILLGALSTVAAMIILPQFKRTKGRPYHPSFSDDRIGVFVPCGGADAEGVRHLMAAAGGVEVTHAA